MNGLETKQPATGRDKFELLPIPIENLQVTTEANRSKTHVNNHICEYNSNQSTISQFIA